MAIPLSNMNIALPFQKNWFYASQPRNLFSTLPTSKFLDTNIVTKTRKLLRTPITPKISTKKTDSIITELQTEMEQQKEEKDGEVSTPEKQISDHWREIHGADDWANMLDPIDPLLRLELIRYGEMAQACYDAFDYDPFSQNCGSCRFIRRNLFDRLGMSSMGYDVSRYLYATSNINLPNFFKKSRWPQVWSRHANWIGYVSVSNDEMTKKLGRRDITISWRGTVTRLEWIADLMDYLRPISSDNIPCPDPTVKDQNCGVSKYSAREQILTEIRRLIHMYPNEELSITVTGHSLGSALAILSAYDIVETGLNITDEGQAVLVTVFSFSGPRVGNVRFRNRLEGLGVKVLRVVNIHDKVPQVPGIFFNEHVPVFWQKLVEGIPWCYSHVGVELALDHKVSPFLKDTGDVSCFHNLEAHLHLLDGLVLLPFLVNSLINRYI
ncbi:Phospholipase A1-Igamma1 [Ranunculus cassubicifolius]